MYACMFALVKIADERICRAGGRKLLLSALAGAAVYQRYLHMIWHPNTRTRIHKELPHAPCPTPPPGVPAPQAAGRGLDIGSSSKGGSWRDKKQE